jgi:hypothetical protein
LYLGVDPYLAMFFQILKEAIYFVFYGIEIFHVRLEKFYFHIFFTISFLLFLFSYTLSRFVHVWGQGYRVTGGGSKAPLFLFLFPWTIRDIFPNLSLWKRRDSVPRFVPDFSGLSLELQTRMVERFLRDILGFVLVPRDTLGTQGHSRVCP